MPAEDPFSTTAQLGYKGAVGMGEGIAQGANAVGQTAVDIAKMKYDQQQKKQNFQFMKDLGIISQSPATRQQKIDAIKNSSQGKIPINIDDNTPDSILDTVIDKMGIPKPIGSINIQPGTEISETGDISYKAQKPEKSVAQTVAEYEEAKKLLNQSQEGGKTDPNAPIPTVDSKGNLKISATGSGGFGGAYVKVARETADAIADGVKQGDMAGFMTAQPVAKELAFKQLHDEGINVTQGIQDYTGIMQLTKTMNQNQMTQLNVAFQGTENDIVPMRKISDELERTGFKPANNLIIKADLNGVSLSPDTPDNQVEAATKYVTQINLMRDTMAVAFMRGGTPTDQALKLTDNILNPAYSNNQIDAALDQVQINLNMRKAALPNQAYIPGRQQNQVSPVLNAAGMGNQRQSGAGQGTSLSQDQYQQMLKDAQGG